MGRKREAGRLQRVRSRIIQLRCLGLFTFVLELIDSTKVEFQPNSYASITCFRYR